ncbi:TPA: mandelate racemase/muconate lactonizing enzyme family protein [Candidatus Poribacteria bacterium]|nr:mandelate racemase/muconate lactonizing enzyme family protein [Candidatus Poribacteria bacterium]
MEGVTIMASGKKVLSELVQESVNTNSSPSGLKITDMRMAVVASNYDYPIIRIDTNQGIYGIGEVRDAGHKENALQFKSMLLGQNPCNVDMIFHAIKRFGNWGREGGGVSGIEIALWDLVGKVYGVPCYQFLGGKYRDRIRLYADTPAPAEPTPEGYAERVLGRKKMGLTFIKFDVGIHVLRGYVEDGVVGTPTKYEYGLGRRWTARGTAIGAQLTDKGIARFVEIVSAVREAVGWDIPLAVDHFGPITVNDGIRLGRALEPYGLAWMEDIIPWWDVEGNLQVTRAINVPTLNGEDIYLWDGWREMIERRAIDIIQPDLLTAGGMLETKKIADYAERYGLPTVLHFAGSPIAFMANLHCAAAIPSFIALENHALDLPFWKDLVTGLSEPLIEEGYVRVPEKPGLGVDLNYEGIEANLRFPGLFEPTDEWNNPKLGFWQPDRRWDK